MYADRVFSGIERVAAARRADPGQPHTIIALVRSLAAGDMGKANIATLLAHLCEILPAASGVLVRRTPAGSTAVMATVPSVPEDDGLPEWLGQIEPETAAALVAAGRTGMIKLAPDTAPDTGANERYLVHAPCYARSCAPDRAALFLVRGNEAEASAVLDRLSIATGLLALFALQSDLARAQRGPLALASAVQAATKITRQERAEAAAMAFCNEIASRWHAERVSLGIADDGDVRLVMMSHCDEIDRRLALARDIEAAMNECCDQDAETSWPRTGDLSVVTRAAERLSTGHGGHRVLCMPLRAGSGAAVGAVLVEFAADAAPTAEDLDALRLLCRLAAPLVLRLHEADRPLPAKLARSVRITAARALGSEHSGAKLAAVGAMAVLAAITLIPAPHRISVPFLIQPERPQVIAAPFDGYLQEVSVDPGDSLRAGTTVLARLETRELGLELATLAADRARYAKQADLARGELRRADEQIARTELAGTDAQIALVQHRMQSAALRAPVDGIVVEGDRRPQIGAAVKRGDTLFEIAPVDRLRVELHVPESRIDEITVGQKGMLAPASQPGAQMPFVVDRIEPMAETREGRNIFRAWADLQGGRPGWLRPGMEGLAKIDAGTGSLIWMWTRDAMDWLRLKMWW